MLIGYTRLIDDDGRTETTQVSLVFGMVAHIGMIARQHKDGILKPWFLTGFLKELGIDGCVYSTPGHSDDSISLMLDSGELFAGDLNPLYELELHRGTVIEKTWNTLMSMHPRKVYYGHAPAADLKVNPLGRLLGRSAPDDIYALVKKIIKYVNKGINKEEIAAKTGADPVFVEDVTRMYVTHPGVSVQGILDRIEIKGK